MKINYLGHSSFLLESGGGTKIVIDPYKDVGLLFPRVKADAVTVSHAHFDHSNVAAVGGEPVVFDEAGQYQIGDVCLRAIERFHDEKRGAKRGKNLIFFYEIDGIKVCHLGDLGENFSEELCQKIRPVDLLFIPVGGNYTIDALEAKKFIGGIAPKIVVPMHYRVPGLTVDIASPEKFLAQFDCVEKRGGAVELDCSDFDSSKESTILVLERSM